jgi:hypothetical protein
MILNVLTSVAITCIIVHSEIFRPIRNMALNINHTLGYWISCPMCFGFWVGLAVSLANGSPDIALGLLSSLFSWAIYNIVTAFGAVGDYYTTVLQSGEENNE